MPNILIVDDSPIDQRRAAVFLEDADYDIEFAASGKEALDRIADQPPHVVLSDIVMPEMDGLELLKRIVANYPMVPVIIMTAHGSEETAVEALQAGAASYVAKSNIPQHLADAVKTTLAVSRRDRPHEEVLPWRTHIEEHFTLDAQWNRPDLLVLHLQNELRQTGWCSQVALLQISTALTEALVNAMDHGNLELESKWREAGVGGYARLGEQRRKQSPYKDRHLHVVAKLTRQDATFVVRDEGRGFDPTTIPDPRDPANIQKLSGRGLMLIQSFMDGVSYNDSGTQITMIKRRPEIPSG